MSELVHYHTEQGIKPALVVEEGRKWMTVLLLHPDPRTHRVKLTDRRFMTPLDAKRPGAVFRRNITSSTTARVKKLLRGVK